MKTNRTLKHIGLVALMLSTLDLPLSTLFGQGTAFTYQGRLGDGGVPAGGAYDLRFTVYALSSGGSAVSGIITNAVTSVSNGLITATVDFGAAVFDGSPRWLEIAVRTNGAGTFVALSPRQPLHPTPYALRAGSISGTVGSASLSGAYTNPVSISNAANRFFGAFIGNGAGLTTLNAAQLTSGTILDARLGTNVALLNTNATFNGRVEALSDLKGLRANIGSNQLLSGEYGSISGGEQNINQAHFAALGGGQLNSVQTNAGWSVIAGGTQNVIQSNVFYSVIGGGSHHQIEGGIGGQHNTIGGGFAHVIRRDSQYATIAGGVQNRVENNGDYGVIAGGGGNVIRSNSVFGSIGGGTANHIQPGARYASIAGGRANSTASDYSLVGAGFGNLINTNADYSVIGGGSSNAIESLALSATVSGGFNNIIESGSDRATIGGGKDNTIQSSADASVIGGGDDNLVQASTTFATINGGFDNAIQANADWSSIGGGWRNTVRTNAQYGTIGGGFLNAVRGESATVGGGEGNVTVGSYATIPGGVGNSATNYAFAAGRRAKANHRGSFVWADSEDADVASARNDQFRVRAAGGVRLDVGYDHWVEFYSDIPALFQPIIRTSVGAYLSVAGIWEDVSDRNVKENFAPVEPQQILEKVVRLPLSTWNYKAEPSSIRRIGPMAQDFHATFGVGTDDKHLAALDVNGVALAAIQGLNQKLTEELNRRDAENAELKQRLEKLEQLMIERTGGKR